MDPAGLERGSEPPVTSLIFPTYNPGPTLRRTWHEVYSFLKSVENWEAIFVCDGCTDGSTEWLSSAISQVAGKVQLVTYSPNRGKGYAVRQGLAAAHGRWRIFTDVDLAYGFDDVMRVARALHDGADVAIGSRSHPESIMTLPTRLQGYMYRRHLQSWAFSRLVRWLLPLQQHDTQAGLKGITREASDRILPHLACNGFGFDCEMLTAAEYHGLRIQELPVRVRYEDHASTTDLLTVGKMVRELWRIRKRWRHQLPAEEPVFAPVTCKRAA